MPVDQGGCWESVAASTRGVCAQLRVLAGADPSVALVAAMHPAVLGYWLATTDAAQPAWEAQRHAVFATAANGRQWGTITSEPGSGGDIMRTRTRAEPDGEATAPDDVPGRRYRLTGDKHFGSGFGISDYMFTTARGDDDDAPGLFFMDMRAARAAGGSEVVVTAEWDGAGMTATQSHAARLERMPATRLAWAGEIDVIIANAAPFITMAFTAVVLGVFDVAVQFGASNSGRSATPCVPSNRSSGPAPISSTGPRCRCTKARCARSRPPTPRAGLHAGLRAKTAIAEAAEAALRRLTQVLGGGTFSRRSPISAWFEDVRALGFLRPPWGLAYDGLFATSFGADGRLGHDPLHLGRFARHRTAGHVRRPHRPGLS